jgi:hypothetical protein
MWHMDVKVVSSCPAVRDFFVAENQSKEEAVIHFSKCLNTYSFWRNTEMCLFTISTPFHSAILTSQKYTYVHSTYVVLMYQYFVINFFTAILTISKRIKIHVS